MVSCGKVFGAFDGINNVPALDIVKLTLAVSTGFQFLMPPIRAGRENRSFS